MQLQIPTEIAGLPVGHLQLSTRARHAVGPLKTIGGLLGMLPNSRHKPDIFTPTVWREVASVIEKLSSTVGAKGVSAWDEFRNSLFVPTDPVGRLSVYFTSPKLALLPPAVRDTALPNLHLSNRALNSLETIGIHTIGGLIDRARDGLPPFRAAGDLTTAEIYETLDALVASVDTHGQISWVRYATARRLALLPARPGAWTGRALVKSLTAEAKSAVKREFGERGLFILQERLRDAAAPQRGFRALGRLLKYSGERTRQLDRSIVTMLRRAIWFDDYRGCSFRFRPELVEPLRSFALELQATGLRIFSSSECKKLPGQVQSQLAHPTRRRLQAVGIGGRGRLPKRAACVSLWNHLLQRNWKIRLHDLDFEGRLILDLLGFRAVVLNETGCEPIVLPKEEKLKLIRDAIQHLTQLLTLAHPEGLSPSELKAALESKLGPSSLSLDVPTIVRTISAAEKRLVGGVYRARTTCLKRLPDRFERILMSYGKPMHFRKLSTKAGISARSEAMKNRPFARVTAALSADPRFLPVSKTGLWSLATWHGVDCRSVAQIAGEILEHAIEPMTEEELWRRISKLRPCLQGSVRTVLTKDSRFQLVERKRWFLRRR
jgi:hypothetical protein